MTRTTDKLFRIAVLALLAGGVSCTNEEIILPAYEDPMSNYYDNNLVYIKDMPQGGALQYNYTYLAAGQDAYAYDREIPESVEIGTVRTSLPAAEDITVTVSIDPSIVEAENERLTAEAAERGDEESPELYLLPECVQLEKTEFVIPAGGFVAAEPVRVLFVDGLKELQNREHTKFMTPVRLAATTGDPNASVSTQESVTLVKFTFTTRFDATVVSFTNSSGLHKLTFDDEQPDGGPIEGAAGSLNTGIQVRFSHPAYTDTPVRLAIDNSLVATYNSEHGTSYRTATSASLLTATVTVSKDQTSSDNVVLRFADGMASLRYGESYLVPVKITSCESFGSEIAGTGSWQSSVFYYEIKCQYPQKMTVDTQSSQGVAIDKTVVTMMQHNGSLGDSDGSYTWQSSPNSMWRNTANEDYWNEFDLKEVYDITCIGFLWESYYRAATSFWVSVSEDKSEWKELGTIEDCPKPSTSWYAVPYSYLKFVTPQHCQYIRIRAWGGGNVYAAYSGWPVDFYKVSE